MTTRVSNDDVFAALHNDDVNVDRKSYNGFIITAHYHTNRLSLRYPDCLIDEELLFLIELRLAAHYFINANPVVKEVKGDDHAYKLNVAAPSTGILGTSFGREANVLSFGKLLDMESDDGKQPVSLFVA